jgi:hypothetical protein
VRNAVSRAPARRPISRHAAGLWARRCRTASGKDGWRSRAPLDDHGSAASAARQAASALSVEGRVVQLEVVIERRLVVLGEFLTVHLDTGRRLDLFLGDSPARPAPPRPAASYRRLWRCSCGDFDASRPDIGPAQAESIDASARWCTPRPEPRRRASRRKEELVRRRGWCAARIVTTLRSIGHACRRHPRRVHCQRASRTACTFGFTKA